MSERPWPAEIDLRGISRDAKHVETRIYLHDGSWRASEKKLWIRVGSVEIRRHDEGERWSLVAYHTNATDFEHDSVYILRLPLIGLAFEMSTEIMSFLHAWVDPNISDWFNVPQVGYDPLKWAAAKPPTTCMACKPKHPVVADGLYLPSFNKTTYHLTMGRRVSIELSRVVK